MTNINDIGIKRIADLICKLQTKELSFVDFVDEFERACYNDISSRSLEYFADGWSKGAVSSFMKVCLRAFIDGDANAVKRLNADLGLECEI